MASETPSTPEPGSGTATAGFDPGILDEQALVAAVLERDRKAAAEFVARYSDPVYSYISRRLAPRAELVEDMVQDVFVVALQKLHSFEGRSSLAGWLLGIARHKVEELYRARLREHEPLPDDDAFNAGPAAKPNVDELIDTQRAKQKTERILEQLPVAYSTALLWRYWEGRSTKDMAAQTGKTEKAIERLLARARAQFKHFWEAS